MSVVTEIIARLLEAGTPFALVEGASELAQIEAKPRAQPAAFVFMAREESADNETFTGPVHQRQERDVAVVIYTENLTDRSGAAASADIDGLKAFVRGKLIGWQPDDGEEPVTHVAWEIVQAAGGEVWGQDTFSSPTYIGETD